MTTNITRKGQVTVPKPFRDHLGLSPGEAVIFELTADGEVRLRKANNEAPRSRFAAVRGSADAGLTTDEIMALTRGE